MFIIIDLRDHDNKSATLVKFGFEAKATIKQLQDKIFFTLRIVIEKQQIFDSNGRRINLLSDSLENAGIRDRETLILKHADLEWWILYKECVESVLKQYPNKFEAAKEAVRLEELLADSRFFDVYVEASAFRRIKHAKIAAWTDYDVILIRKATEQYFHNLYDQNRGNEDPEFICHFEERDAELGGSSTNTLAFVRIHGEYSVSKYNVKCHHYGPKGTSSGQVPDVSEFYCYKLLELIGVGPKSHIIPPSTSTGTKTNTYIATQWDDKFESLENVIDENSLCADVVVQLVMLQVLLFICDLHEQNCGRWKGTKDAAIVDFAPTHDLQVYSDIKSKMITTFPHKEWKTEYSAVKNQHDDNSWLKIAKVYLDKWDLSSKIELAREQLDPTNELLKSQEISFEMRHLRLSPTDELKEYIDTLNKNLENLQTLLNSIV